MCVVRVDEVLASWVTANRECLCSTRPCGVAHVDVDVHGTVVHRLQARLTHKPAQPNSPYVCVCVLHDKGLMLCMAECVCLGAARVCSCSSSYCCKMTPACRCVCVCVCVSLAEVW